MDRLPKRIQIQQVKSKKKAIILNKATIVLEKTKILIHLIAKNKKKKVNKKSLLLQLSLNLKR